MSPSTTHGNLPTRSGGLSTALLFALFFASGVTALVYQIVWQRMLTLFGGADLQAVTMVVTAFMAGLGFGSLAGGYLADRLTPRGRLHAFAVCEAAIALFALASAGLYYDVLYVRFGAESISRGGMATIVFLVTLIPTFLMGMSLPMLSALQLTTETTVSRWVSRLYGWNTLGAAAGSLLTVLVLMPRFDMRTLLQVAAMINGICALAAVAMARSWKHPPAPTNAATAPVAKDGLGIPFAAWVALYAFSGFVALSLEIVWFRALGVMMKSNALTFGYLLSFYLAGVGLGALLARKRTSGPQATLRAYLLVQAGVALVAGASLTALRLAVDHLQLMQPLFRYFASSAPQNSLSAFATVYFVLPVLLIVPSTIMMGWSFGLLQHAVQRDASKVGKRVGWLQSANILGSMVGALLTGVVLLDLLGSAETLRAIVAGSVVLLVIYARIGATTRWRLMPAAAAIALVLTMPGQVAFWATLHGASPDRVVVGEDGSGLIVFRRDADQTRAFMGGISQSWLPYRGIHTALGALPAMLHPRPERVAVIGLASGDTLFSIAGREETTRIDNIEIVAPQLVALRVLAERAEYPALDMILADPRITYRAADARAVLRRSQTRYDIIEIDALLPRSASAGNVYSVEFFALLRRSLLPGGYAVTWIPTPRTHASFLAVFPYVMRFGDIAVGSDAPMVFSRDAVIGRMAAPFTRAHYANGGVDLAGTLAAYLAQPPVAFGPSFDRSGLTDVNRDLFPKDEFGVISQDQKK